MNPDVVIVKPDGTRKAVRLSQWHYKELPAAITIPRLSPTGVGLDRYYRTDRSDGFGRPIYMDPSVR